MTHPTDDDPALKPSDEARRLVEAVRVAITEALDDLDDMDLSAAIGFLQSFRGYDFFDPVAKAAIARLETTPQTAGEAKPVAWRWHRHFKGLWHYDEEKPEFSDPTIVPQPLYAAPPHADLVAENTRLRAYALDVTKALTGLSGGGSENFAGEDFGMFKADIPFCVEKIRARETRLRDMWQKSRAALTNGGKNARSDAGEAGE